MKPSKYTDPNETKKLRAKAARDLTKLGEFLVALPPRRFNITVWAQNGFKGRMNVPKEKECGFAACSMGWATKLFRSLKLEYPTADTFDEWHNYYGGTRKEYREEYLPDFYAQADTEIMIIDHEGFKHLGFEAAEVFFGITQDETRYLFSHKRYKNSDSVTPQQAGKRILEFVEDRK